MLDALRSRTPREYEPVRAPVLDPNLRQCRVHEVAWEGTDGCWCCEAGIAALNNY